MALPGVRRHPLQSSAALRALLFGLLCGAVLLLLIRTIPLPLAPRCVLSQDEIDLGVVQSGQVVTAELHLRNAGARELHFEINPHCGCTAVEPQQGVIAGGESVVIQVSVRASRLAAPGDVTTVDVYSNDPEHPRQVIFLKASPGAVIEVRPTLVDFASSRATNSDDAEMVTVISRGHGDIASHDVSLSGLSTGALVPGEFRSDGTSVAIPITLNAGNQTGLLLDSCELSIPRLGFSQRVSFRASISGSISPIPRMLFTHIRNNTPAAQSFQCRFVHGDGSPVNLRELRLSPEVSALLDVKVVDDSHEIAIELTTRNAVDRGTSKRAVRGNLYACCECNNSIEVVVVPIVAVLDAHK